jgi:class III poly(R)-hydroxyalkanoic acid synthase PhaE subunit
MAAAKAGAGGTAGDWQALSQQFLGAWTEAARKAGMGDGKTPWHEGLENWSRLFKPQGEGQGAMVERMMGGAKQFLDMAQGVAANAAGGGAMGGAPAWSEAIAKAFGQLSPLNNPMLEALRSMVGEGATSFEQLAAETHRMAEPLRHEMSALLTFPTFGYTRERQERTQNLSSAAVEFQEWVAKYNALMLKASQSAIGRLEDKLAERSEPGRELQSLRAVYDLWVDAAEDGYAEIALSDEFRHVYGSLVNAQMRVRKLVNEEIERNTQGLGMPTRSELNAVHKKLADLRRAVGRIEEYLGFDQDVAAAPAEEPVAAAPAPRPAKPRKAARPAPAARRKARTKGKPVAPPSAIESVRAAAGQAVKAASEVASSFAAQLAAARKQSRGKGG